MKKLQTPLFVLCLWLGAGTYLTSLQAQAPTQSYSVISLSGGYDNPLSYDDNNPYVDYRGGLGYGLSYDWYSQNRWGLGIEFYGMTNYAFSTYPTTNLVKEDGTPLLDIDAAEDNIVRGAIAIGPNYSFWSNNGKLKAEISVRAGVQTITGGGIAAITFPVDDMSGDFRFAKGSDLFRLSNDGYGHFLMKGHIRVHYFVTEKIGIHAGVHNFWHFNVLHPGASIPVEPFTSAYVWYNDVEEINGQNVVSDEINFTPTDESSTYSSIGIFAGVTFKFQKKGS